ncbi:MGMT family protein [Acinetobacter towneri]|uniref:MGMT family protein n=1 Tax=Acinetobacter towneri TaxID=202956 RepID=UPI0025783E74|nr:MGMT family protein [Acinetobacter towneri]MDM1753830.1 MGMT family protein [Acinetobacter towneri]
MQKTLSHKPSDELAHMILNVVCLIPAGQVATYGQVARLAGLPKHARLVGYVLKHLSAEHTVPWHRVINAQGEISLSKLNAQGENIQILKLQAEGILVIAEKVNLKQYQWQN